LDEREEGPQLGDDAFRRMVESVEDYAIFLLAPDGTVASWNRGAERLEGYRAAEIVGRSFARFYTEEDVRAGKPARALERAAADGRFEDEGWRVRKDGSRFWASAVLTVVRDDGGGHLGFAKVTRDFTARRRMEEALRQNEQRLAGMFDHAAVGIVEVDRDDRIVTVNERALEILGYRREALLGRTIHEITHPDDRPSSDRLNAEIHEGHRGFADYEKRFLRGDGSPVWAHVKVTGVRDGAGRWVRSVGTIEDVTDAREARRALREERDFIAAVVDTTAAVVMVFDPQGRIVRCNGACERATGYAAAELRGTHFSALVPAEELEGVTRIWGATVRGEVPNAFENRWRARDGSLRSFQFSNTALFDGEGRLTYVVATGLDVTARVAAEAELRRTNDQLRASLTAREDAERRFRRVLEANPMGALIGHADGRVEFANDAYLGMIGRSAEDLARGAIRWDRITPPEHLDADRRAIAQAIERGASELYEKEYVRPDGARIPVLVACATLGAGGLAAFTLDITDRKRAEQALAASEAKFRAVFEHAAIGMGRARFADARWEDVNDAFCLMLGRSREEMLRTPWPEMTHPDDVAADLAGFRALAAGELREYAVEKRFLHARGHEVWARLTLSVVDDDRGRPDYEIAIIEDIGERKRAQAELRAANARLREADRRKDEFLAVLSHELRNPLAPIKNSLFVLERAPAGGAQARRAHEVIGRQVVHLTRLVDDLLDVTRISRGKIRLQRERVDLRELVLRTAEDHRSLFEASGVSLGVDAREPVRVEGDAIRLAQIVGNLLTNAAKFTARGGRVDVHLAQRPGEAVIRVRDDGAGIPPDLLERLFEPFVQAESTLDRSKGGLGLGLALVKGLAELHGGGASARSAGAGKGAEFEVRLPAAAAETAASAHPGPAQPHRPLSSGTSRSRPT
jgi:PAS domain S-box-containing protein